MTVPCPMAPRSSCMISRASLANTSAPTASPTKPRGGGREGGGYEIGGEEGGGWRVLF